MRVGERVLVVLERILDAFASLKLAIFVISGLAFFLAVATVYESVYGGPAVQTVVYASPAFIAVMVLLAINVAAAVIVRYPFKRKHTGFVITHIGIETLLLGCLISFRQSAEGVVAMRAGQTVDAIDSINEGVFVSWGDGNQVRQEATPLDCWHEAGYPGVGRFVAGIVKPLPEKPRWEGAPVTRFLAPNVKLEILDWLPAAKYERQMEADPAGSPVVKLRLAGKTPNGMVQDETAWLYQEGSPGAAASLFGGMIEAVLWQTKSPAEVEAFLHPTPADQLPPSGVVSVFAGGVWQKLDVVKDLNKPTAVGTSGWRATLIEYFPESRWDGTKLVKSGDVPNDPMARVKLESPAGTVDWVVSARYPFLTGSLGAAAPAGTETPVVLFDHPAVYVTQKDGQRGRLQLLQSQDGKLYSRRFGLRGLAEAPAEMTVGQEGGGFMGLKLSVLAHSASAKMKDGFLPASINPSKMADAMRAVKVALTVDGTRQETWLGRGAGTTQLITPRGPMKVAYGFDALRLPFQLKVTEARMTRDPGSNNAATYESDVEVVANDGKTVAHKVTMNEPLNAAGYTFYQSGFDDSASGGPITVLRMRQDAGRLLKYAGCGLIVLGIFTMFYMKAYLQKSALVPRPTAATPKVTASAA